MPKIKQSLHDCRVRLNGSLTHDVPKFGITDKELSLLRKIHGEDDDAVIVNDKTVGESEFDERELHMMLARVYGRNRVEEFFRVDLTGFDQWIDDQLSLEQMEREEAAARRQKEFQREVRSNQLSELNKAVLKDAGGVIAPAPQVVGA